MPFPRDMITAAGAAQLSDFIEPEEPKANMLSCANCHCEFEEYTGCRINSYRLRLEVFCSKKCAREYADLMALALAFGLAK